MEISGVSRQRKSAKQIDDRHLRLEYLGGRCTICKRSVKAVEERWITSKGYFEFNHIDPTQKSKIYEKMIRRVMSTEQFDELDKCNLLCRGCHAVWTSQRFRGNVRINLEFRDGRRISRKFPFHGLIEVKNGQPVSHTFPDNPCDLAPYSYSLGKGRQYSRAGFELEKQLLHLLLATRRRRFLRIWDGQGLVFQAERIDPAQVRYQYLVRFPLLKFAGCADKGKKPHLWGRNGKLIIKGQPIKKKGAIEHYVEYASIERGLAQKKSG
jgi:hypothetical protein